MSCISCRLAEATLEHRQDSSMRFCGNECYEDWKQQRRCGAAAVAPIGEGVFMRMLRTPVPVGRGAILTKDLFWKIMSYEGMTPRALVYDIGDTSVIRVNPEIHYATWRKNVRKILQWIIESKTPIGADFFLREMLWISIEEDFIDLRNVMWKQLPMLHGTFINFDRQHMIEMMCRHFPQPLWESIQRLDPLSITHASNYAYAAASSNPMHTELLQYFGKYYAAELADKLLRKNMPSEEEMEQAKDLIQNPDTYVSANNNELYNFLDTKLKGMTYQEEQDHPLRKYLEKVVTLIRDFHPKFKMPVRELLSKVFGSGDTVLLEKFVPRYSDKDILELFGIIISKDHGSDTQFEKEQYIEIILKHVSRHIRLTWPFIKHMMKKQKYAWVLEKLISRNLIVNINDLEKENVFSYIELYGAEDVPRFIEFVVLYQKPRVDFSGLLLLDVGRVLSMGPASKLLMQEVLRQLPSSAVQLMDNEFKRRIRDMYDNDYDIAQLLLWKDDNESLMEPEQKKTKN